MLGLSSFGWGYGQRAVVATVSYARQRLLCERLVDCPPAAHGEQSIDALSTAVVHRTFHLRTAGEFCPDLPLNLECGEVRTCSVCSQLADRLLTASRIPSTPLLFAQFFR